MSAPELNFVREGTGAPILLVHGLGGSLGIWRPVMDRLAGERDVIAVDLPGFGGSPMAEGATGQAPAAMAAALERLCRSLGVERPHVAGNSLGAWVALEMAKHRAAASVTAISPAGMWGRALGPRTRSPQGLGNRLRPLIKVLVRSRRGRGLVLRTTMAHPERMPAGDAAALVDSYLDSPGYEASNAAMRAGVFDHEGLVDVPVTIAWGQLDRLVGRPSRGRIPPGAQVIEMPGWGHMPTWDDPDGVAALLLETSAGGMGSAGLEPATPRV